MAASGVGRPVLAAAPPHPRLIVGLLFAVEKQVERGIELSYVPPSDISHREAILILLKYFPLVLSAAKLSDLGRPDG